MIPQDLSSFTSSSSAVDPWLRQLVASNHVGAPSRTISLSNHSPHGHIAPKVPTTITTTTITTTDTTTIATTTPPLAAKHITSMKKLHRVGWLGGWSAKRYYHSLGVLCNQRLICPWPARSADKFVHRCRTDKLTNSNSVSGSDHYGGMTRALFKICHSDYLLVTPALSYPPPPAFVLSNYSALFCLLCAWHG